MRHSALKRTKAARIPALNSAYNTPVIAPVREMPAPRKSAKTLTRQQRIVYLAIMGVMLFATLQCVRSCVVNAYKSNILIHQFGAVQEGHKAVATENQVLHDQITQYNSPKGLEMLARERLNLVGPQEVLVNIFPEKAPVHQVAQGLPNNI